MNNKCDFVSMSRSFIIEPNIVNKFKEGKQSVPEYRNQISGASLVHDESDELVFRCKNGNLLAYCIEYGYNMVIPKIGHSINSICNFCNVLKEVGYSVYLVSVDLDRAKATQRAYNRFKESKRYVPLSLIFDSYANESTLNYFRIKQRYSDIFDGFAQLSTDSRPVVLVEQINLNMLCDLF